MSSLATVCSSVTLAMQPVAENAGVLLSMPLRPTRTITYKAGVGGFKWTFRNYPTDENRASSCSNTLPSKRGIKKFAVLSVDSDYGRGAIALTKKYLDEYGAEIVSEDYYKDKETDFRPRAGEDPPLRRAGDHHVRHWPIRRPIVARQMVEARPGRQGDPDRQCGVQQPGSDQGAPTALNGAVEAAAWMPEWDTPRNKAFVETYRKANTGETPNIHAYAYWETMRLVAEAAKQAKSGSHGRDPQGAVDDQV